LVSFVWENCCPPQWGPTTVRPTCPGEMFRWTIIFPPAWSNSTCRSPSATSSAEVQTLWWVQWIVRFALFQPSCNLCVRGSQPGPFFLDGSGHLATKPWFVRQIHDILARCNIPQDEYAGHGFRIGAATTVALEDSMIQILGCWYSSAFLQYVRTPKEKLATLSVTLSGQTIKHPSSFRD